MIARIFVAYGFVHSGDILEMVPLWSPTEEMHHKFVSLDKLVVDITPYSTDKDSFNTLLPCLSKGMGIDRMSIDYADEGITWMEHVSTFLQPKQDLHMSLNSLFREGSDLRSPCSEFMELLLAAIVKYPSCSFTLELEDMCPAMYEALPADPPRGIPVSIEDGWMEFGISEWTSKAIGAEDGSTDQQRLMYCQTLHLPILFYNDNSFEESLDILHTILVQHPFILILSLGANLDSIPKVSLKFSIIRDMGLCSRDIGEYVSRRAETSEYEVGAFDTFRLLRTRYCPNLV